MDKLRLNRNHLVKHGQPLPSSPTVSQSKLSSFPQPPSQSRDGSVISRFFPASPPSLGNILVPNSSPNAQDDSSSQSLRPYTHSTTRTAPSSSSAFSMNGLLQVSMGSAFDPLSAPGGLISHAGPSNASSRRRPNEDQNVKHEDGPPRKKLNRCSSEDASNISGSPPSPEICRSNHRRHIPAIGREMLSLSSDESTQESSRAIAGPSKPRLTKDRPPSSPGTTQMSEPPSGRDFISFKISHPIESPVRIQEAWKQASGDVKRAIGFLKDPSWFPSPDSRKVLSSRLAKLDEASRAHRVAEKEKGKKSMIYANRLVLETRAPATPSPQKSSLDSVTRIPKVQASPLTPGPIASRQKRAKKLVINSDSDSAVEESEDDGDTIYEKRTLDYLNSSDSDALQELTGKEIVVVVEVIRLIYVKVVLQTKLKLSSIYDLSSQATISGQSLDKGRRRLVRLASVLVCSKTVPKCSRGMDRSTMYWRTVNV